jgi:osmotically-inducible protein OsmY
MVAALLPGAALAANATASRFDATIENKVKNTLSTKSAFHNVEATTEDGIVTLSGTTELYRQKLDAAKKVRNTEHMAGVRNLIEVSGANISDDELRQKLARKLAYDRVGYADNAFSAFTLEVKNGVASVGGEVYQDLDRTSALDLVANTPGVKDVIDNVKVLPTSIFDDDIRVRAARAIYGDPTLARYAMVPAAPIRIVVDRGHVTLYGAVDSQLDRQIAGVRANQVFGVFNVDNQLTTPKQVVR